MKEVDYVVCPLCGMNRVRKSKDKGWAMWPGYEVRLATAPAPTEFSKDSMVMQVRVSGGKIKGSGVKGRGMAPAMGFKFDPTKSLTLEQMVGVPEYASDLATLAKAVANVYNQFKLLGLVK